MCIFLSVNPITTNKKMSGLCGVWCVVATHTYLPDEMSNDSNSLGRKREKATEGGGGGSKEVAWLMSVPVVF